VQRNQGTADEGGVERDYGETRRKVTKKLKKKKKDIRNSEPVGLTVIL
jgi:hypothetical protein